MKRDTTLKVIYSKVPLKGLPKLSKWGRGDNLF
jgi:hypothetical protein